MGTASITRIKGYQKENLCNMYRHFDGYVDGHGYELAEFLSGKKLVNGISGNSKNIFNGPGCMAASIVSYFKGSGEPEGIYLESIDSVGQEEYVYTVYPTGDLNSPGPIKISVKVYDEEIFDGTPEELLKFKE